MSDVQTEAHRVETPELVAPSGVEVAPEATGAEDVAVPEPAEASEPVAEAPSETESPDEAPAEPAAPDPLEGLRVAVIAGCERLNQACQGADADFIRGQLEDLRARVTSVRPADLTPRTGLAGLFDSRKKRLARFRDHATDLAPAISTAAVKLRDAAAELARRNGVLNKHHQGLLNAITGLDEALMAFPERADPTRDEGLKHLPLTRMVQNVDARLAETAGQLAGAAMAWRDGLLRDLGADGKTLTPLRRVHPDQNALAEAREGLLAAIDQAEAAVAVAVRRRDEVIQRLGRTLDAVRGQA